MRLFRVVSPLICLLLLLFSSMNVITSESIANTIVIDYHPTSVMLQPDEQGTIVLNIKNNGNDECTVAISFEYTKSGHTRCDVNDPIFTLPPDGSINKTVHVETNAIISQDPGSSDFVVVISWGRNISIDDNGKIIKDSVDGSRSLYITVSDDLTGEYRLMIIIFSLIIITSLISTYWIWKNHKKHLGNEIY